MINDSRLLCDFFRNEHVNFHIAENFLKIYGIDINVQDSDGETSLMILVHNNNIELVKLLLKYGADMNIPDNNRNTPLMIARRKGFIEVAKILASGAPDEMP